MILEHGNQLPRVYLFIKLSVFSLPPLLSLLLFSSIFLSNSIFFLLLLLFLFVSIAKAEVREIPVARKSWRVIHRA